MKKPPKFLLAKNEAAQPGAAFVVHTQEPAFVGEIRNFESLIKRDEFIDEHEDKEIILITPTTLLIILKYLESTDKAKNRSFLERRIVHWITANYINFSTA